jgi:N-acetylmuramoyl-L-alanine amidase
MFSLRRVAVPIAVAVVLTTSAAAADVAAASPTISSFTLTGSPFAQNFAPLPTAVTAKLSLNRAARVRLTVRRPDGTLVRRLVAGSRLGAGTHSFAWDGINERGRPARDGQFVIRAVATAGGVDERQERPVRKGLPAIYPENPGSVVIVVDPGHGGRFPGATQDGFAEKDFNLAISLQLRALLERAGVQVVMTRTTDVAVNDPASDENGDGVLDRYDDDLERSDVANQAMADVAVHVHNNAAPNLAAHGTEAYTDGNRTWTPQGLDLAGDVLAGVYGTLDSYRSPEFQPRNSGVHKGWYYYMGPYDPPFLIRAALMTSVLSESLFVSNAMELDALKRPDIQQAIAAGIYLGVADYLNSRPYGARYQAVTAPGTAVAGDALSYAIRVTNRGNAVSAGWTLRLGAVSAVPRYDGSGAPGDEIGSVAIPDGLGSGQSVEVDIPARAPGSAGDWLVKTDITLADGASFADAGVAPLQIPLTTTIAP